MTETIERTDQIRGVAMALRHWFAVDDTETLMREFEIKPPAQPSRGKKPALDRRKQAFSFHALPPQVVRLKTDAPVSTFHLLQNVFDDGELRADPWRWWFCWISIEFIARLGPDRRGEQVRDFILSDDSLDGTRETAARWLASNPGRLVLLDRRYASFVAQAAERHRDQHDDDREALLPTMAHPLSALVGAMADEAAAIAAAVTDRIAERVERL